MGLAPPLLPASDSGLAFCRAINFFLIVTFMGIAMNLENAKRTRPAMEKGLRLMVFAVLAATLLYSWATTSSYSGSSDVPLPQDVRIVPPDPGLPPEIKVFSGKWGGRWRWQDLRDDTWVDGVLIVEKIMNEQQAIVVAAAGTGTGGWWINRVWERSTANFSKTEEGVTLLVNSLTSNISGKMKFRIWKGRMIGVLDVPGSFGSITATMKRIQ